jgi:predicted HTH transcriptional regulator
MIDPYDVFMDPKKFLDFLTASDDTQFEGQHFDRKEAGRLEDNGNVSKKQLDKVIENIQECISAFANTKGGLLVLGISKKGQILGIDHLNDDQRSRITDINKLLKNHLAQSQFYTVENENGDEKTICLIYVPSSNNGICETLDKSQESWYRSGSQNIPMNDSLRQQLLRDKGFTLFENIACYPYEPDLVDKSVLEEFRRSFQTNENDISTDEEILYQLGAIIKSNNQNSYMFTYAGLLFFAINPQRVLPWAYVRVLRFENSYKQYEQRNLPTLDKGFTGPITKQIRDLRGFFKDSGFFKVYQRRKPNGGFEDEPELPAIAVDEAIVNAIVHRDYAIQLPIECERFQDAFITINPGPVRQRNHQVPDHFTLNTTRLTSTPRNQQLITWLHKLKDERGSPFIQSLGEGTKQMKFQMELANLPSPIFDTDISETRVTLISNAIEREANMRANTATRERGFTNLFPLSVVSEGEQVKSIQLRDNISGFMKALKDKLKAQGWYIDSDTFGRVIAHQRGSKFSLSYNVDKYVHLYPAYIFQLYFYWGQAYLSIDYKLVEKNILSIAALQDHFEQSKLENKTVVAQWNGWHPGKIISIDALYSDVIFFDFNETVRIDNKKIIPNLDRDTIKQILSQKQINFDLNKSIKQYSLSNEPNAARIRAERTKVIAENLQMNIFPLLLERVWKLS